MRGWRGVSRTLARSFLDELSDAPVDELLFVSDPESEHSTVVPSNGVVRIGLLGYNHYPELVTIQPIVDMDLTVENAGSIPVTAEEPRLHAQCGLGPAFIYNNHY